MATFRGRYIIEHSNPNTRSDPFLDLQVVNRGQHYNVRLEPVPFKDHQLLLMTVLRHVKPNARNAAALKTMFASQLAFLADNPGGNAFEETFGVVVYPIHDQATPELKQFCGDCWRGVHEVARNTVATIRWRYDLDWPLEWSTQRRLDYSLDGENFFSPPVTAKMYSTTGRISIRISPEVEDELQHTIGDTSSLLPHQFLWEAMESLEHRPRSALFLSTAAVEIGFKQLVARLVPQAGWLVENVPSPPLAEMLRSYFPTLPGVITIQQLRITDEIIKEVRKAVTIRNRLIHTGKQDVEYEWLRGWLDTAELLLYAFDFAAGHGWVKRFHGLTQVFSS